jgi:hypothetical protein
MLLLNSASQQNIGGVWTLAQLTECEFSAVPYRNVYHKMLRSLVLYISEIHDHQILALKSKLKVPNGSFATRPQPQLTAIHFHSKLTLQNVTIITKINSFSIIEIIKCTYVLGTTIELVMSDYPKHVQLNSNPI